MKRSMSATVQLSVVVAITMGAAMSCSRPTSERPPAEASSSSPHPTWGETMGEVGRRFELVGRAATAGRTELARYHLGEIEEAFEGPLTHAEPPHEGHVSVLQPMRAAFLQANITEIRRALEARDRQGFGAAFAQTAAACNGCHQASGHGFIEIPTTPGVTVPRLDPVP